MSSLKTGDAVAAIPHTLMPAQYGDLAEVPTELEWLANLTNPKTREAYPINVREFSTFASLRRPAEFHTVTRAHVIAWRKHLETRGLADSTIRRKLWALSSLLDYLCERNAVAGNPIDSIKRPAANTNEGSTPALADAQARKLLDAPPEDTLKGVRDRAILATLLYHSMCCEELCRLRLRESWLPFIWLLPTFAFLSRSVAEAGQGEGASVLSRLRGRLHIRRSIAKPS